MTIGYEPNELNNYEGYFSERRVQNFDERKVDYRNAEIFTDLMKMLPEKLRETEHILFDTLMKMEWVNRNFQYDGKTVADFVSRRGQLFDYASAVFMRNTLKYTPRFWRVAYFKAWRSYADEMFPDFETRDPRETYTFPYQYMNLESLFFVHKIEGRMELLAQGEKHKMGYNDFRDYVMKAQSRFYKETGRRHKQYFSMNSNTGAYLAEIPTIEEELKRKRI